MIRADKCVWRAVALLLLLGAIQEAAGGSPSLRAVQAPPQSPKASSSPRLPTSSPTVFVDAAKLAVETDCASPWYYMTGPSTPFQFPSKAEAEALRAVQTSQNSQGRVHPGDEYVLVECGEEHLPAYSLFPRTHTRKAHISAPSLVLLSVPFLPALPTLPDKQVYSFPNHHLASSLFDQPDSTGLPAFSPLPRADMWKTLSAAGYSTMAVLPHCDVNVETRLRVDWLGYELFCAIESLDVGQDVKEELAWKATLDYIGLGLNATSALFAYLSLSTDITEESYWTTLLSTVFPRDHQVVLILESPSSSLVVSSTPLPQLLYSTSQDLELLLLTLSASPVAKDLGETGKCGQRGVGWWSCEARRQVPTEVLEGLVQQVEGEMGREERGEMCRERKVDRASLVVRTSSPLRLSLHFTLSGHPFVSLFTPASSLLSPWQLSRILPLAPDSLCPAQLQRPRLAYCVC